MVVHPIIISVLPMFTSIRQLNFFEIFTRNPYIHLSTMTDGYL